MATGAAGAALSYRPPPPTEWQLAAIHGLNRRVGGTGGARGARGARLPRRPRPADSRTAIDGVRHSDARRGGRRC